MTPHQVVDDQIQIITGLTNAKCALGCDAQ